MVGFGSLEEGTFLSPMVGDGFGDGGKPKDSSPTLFPMIMRERV